MKTLLAVDGSDHSYEAARALQFFARSEQVTILHALNVPRPAYPMMMPEVTAELYDTLERQMREDGMRLLDRIQSLLPMRAGPTAKLLEAGPPAEVIVTAAEQRHVDLIVMGARGLGPVKERLLGSVSHRVLSLAPCAKLIVTSPVKAMKRILLPLQGPSDTDAAIRFLQLKPFNEPVELHLLTVLPSTQPPWPVDTATVERLEKQAVQDARLYIDDVAAGLRKLGYQATATAALGTPVDTILREADALRPDLILMGSRSRRGLARFVLGSTAHALLHQHPCPILVFE